LRENAGLFYLPVPKLCLAGAQSL